MKGKWPKKMPVEVYFLKYAFPCAFVSLQRKKITQSQYEELEKAAIKEKVLDRKKLEKTFAPAFRRLKILAKEKDLEWWSRELMQEYYWHRHNKFIMEGEGDYAKAPGVLKKLCMVQLAEVVRKEGKGMAVVELENGKERAVNTTLVGRVRKGNRVMVHYGYIAEKITL